ncbi:hypothetical protein PR048_003541 [Dryococelus australis]|uniref:Uncharacterized protein n=1 Tax=Dryococelus australis TaxID=614101 RepID=A0ABQ9INE0_9NEOP|nr:hypothetical protein PR048_003541 [Dryococelus australis]
MGHALHRQVAGLVAVGTPASVNGKGAAPTDLARRKVRLGMGSCRQCVGNLTLRKMPELRRTGFDFRRGRPRIFACGSRAGRCRWPAGFLGDIPFPPLFRTHLGLTLIGSQDRPTLSKLYAIYDLGKDNTLEQRMGACSSTGPDTGSDDFLRAAVRSRWHGDSWPPRKSRAQCTGATTSSSHPARSLHPPTPDNNSFTYLLDHFTHKSRGGETARALASRKGEPGSNPLRGRSSMTDGAAGRWVFSGVSRFPSPCVPVQLHTYLVPPSSGLKTPNPSTLLYLSPYRKHSCSVAPSSSPIRDGMIVVPNQFDLGPNVNVLQQQNFMILDLRFVELGPKIEISNRQFWRFEMNFSSSSSPAVDSNGATVFCVDLRSNLGSSFKPRWCNRTSDLHRNKEAIRTTLARASSAPRCYAKNLRNCSVLSPRLTQFPMGSDTPFLRREFEFSCFSKNADTLNAAGRFLSCYATTAVGCSRVQLVWKSFREKHLSLRNLKVRHFRVSAVTSGCGGIHSVREGNPAGQGLEKSALSGEPPSTRAAVTPDSTRARCRCPHRLSSAPALSSEERPVVRRASFSDNALSMWRTATLMFRARVALSAAGAEVGSCFSIVMVGIGSTSVERVLHSGGEIGAMGPPSLSPNHPWWYPFVLLQCHINTLGELGDVRHPGESRQNDGVSRDDTVVLLSSLGTRKFRGFIRQRTRLHNLSCIRTSVTSPPSKANRTRFRGGSLPGFSLVGIVLEDASGFSRGYPTPNGFPAFLHIHLASPLLALKTSLLRGSQIPSLYCHVSYLSAHKSRTLIRGVTLFRLAQTCKENISSPHTARRTARVNSPIGKRLVRHAQRTLLAYSKASTVERPISSEAVTQEHGQLGAALDDSKAVINV